MVDSSEVYVRKGRIADIEEEPEQGLQEAGKQELKAHFIQLRAKGLSLSKIAKRMKLSKTTLANWSQELEAEIAGLKAMELEALQEQYFLLKEGRIRLLGGLLKKLQQEADQRDLTSLPTDKLLDLLLKYQEALQGEYVEARPLSQSQIGELQSMAGSGTKMDSQAIAKALEETLQRYKAGLITMDQARQELALLIAALKAQEQAVIEIKLERLEAVLDDRRN